MNRSRNKFYHGVGYWLPFLLPSWEGLGVGSPLLGGAGGEFSPSWEGVGGWVVVSDGDWLGNAWQVDRYSLIIVYGLCVAIYRLLFIVECLE
ncbi:MAG: hypothetical protein AAGA60_07785 [Cyanobacteria bacterium P01_E01_bin.42]